MKQVVKITSADLTEDQESLIEETLRPNSFNQVIGRQSEKKSLQIMIESAKKRQKPLDHILFHGPPGLGKTSLAFVVAKEMGNGLHVTSGSALDKAGDIAAILSNLEEGSILFIDEIHRLKRTIEEVLYPAMEDQAIDIVLGKGPNAKTLRLDLPSFTIIGATTKLSMLSSPLRDRFGMTLRLDFYSDEELVQLIQQKAGMMGIVIDTKAAEIIAKCSRMTARIAIRILKRTRDLAVVKHSDKIDEKVVNETLEIMGVDDLGLHEIDRSLIYSLLKNFSNRPVGLKTLAASISEEPETVESVYEPFLLKKGYLMRSQRGRQLTDKALEIFSGISE